jgi:hypothetical protein
MSRDWTNLLWREKTWSERGLTVVSSLLALVVCAGMFVGGLLILGQGLEGVSRHNSEHRHCLQQATNGLEIEQCR